MGSFKGSIGHNIGFLKGICGAFYRYYIQGFHKGTIRVQFGVVL